MKANPVVLVFQLPNSPLPEAACFARRAEHDRPTPSVAALPDVDTPEVHEAMVAALDAYAYEANVYSHCFTDAELGTLASVQLSFAYMPIAGRSALVDAFERDGFVVGEPDRGDDASTEVLSRHLQGASAGSVRTTQGHLSRRLPFHAQAASKAITERLVAVPSEVEGFVADVTKASIAWTDSMRETFLALAQHATLRIEERMNPAGAARPKLPSATRSDLPSWIRWLAASAEAQRGRVRAAEQGASLHQLDEPFLLSALIAGQVDATSPSGVSPLWHAVRCGQVGFVKKLLRAGARPDAHDDLRIARVADEARVASLWSGVAEPGHPAPVGPSTLLHVAMASASSSRELVTLLLQAGLAVDARDRFGDTPLHVAAASHADPELMGLLLDAGADVDAIDRRGFSPLDHCRASSPHVRLLLARGADPNGGPKSTGGATVP